MQQQMGRALRQELESTLLVTTTSGDLIMADSTPTWAEFPTMATPSTYPGISDMIMPNPQSTWLCDYCGKMNKREQLVCGECEWDGCGGAKP
jgi:hypothetical protein